MTTTPPVTGPAEPLAHRTAGAVLTAATVTTGLAAGTFYVFACAVMPALSRSDDRTYVEVMRNINEVIQNPVFFLSFLGALVLTGVSAWQSRDARCRGWVWAGLLAYGLAFAVTVVVNVPLNDDLAGTGDPGALREHFEDAWVRWNAARAVLSTVALGCLTRALAVDGRGPRTRDLSSRGRPG